jgi:hypothetical protein
MLPEWQNSIHILPGQREENFSWDSSSIILKWILYKQTNLRYRNTEYNYILYA